jgi:DNA-directed RNA polymerase subunit M/transcription elongation factor TFIIS
MLDFCPLGHKSNYIKNCKLNILNIKINLLILVMSDINKLRILTKSNINEIINNNSLAEDIESSIYDFTMSSIEDPSLISILFDNIYEQKSNEILEHFKLNKKYLLDAISSKQINPKQIADCKAEELNPEKFSKIINKKSYNKYKNNKGSNIFTCPKCKKAECEVTQKQTRSGDEPPTIFVKCLVCGHVMKF